MTEAVQSIIITLIDKVERRCGALGPLIKLAYTCEDRLGIETNASQMPCYPLFQYYKRLKAGLPVCKFDVITGYYAFKIFEVVNQLDTPDKLQNFYEMVGIIEVYGYTDNDENIAIEWYQQTGNPIFLLSYIINLQDILNCK